LGLRLPIGATQIVAKGLFKVPLEDSGVELELMKEEFNADELSEVLVVMDVKSEVLLKSDVTSIEELLGTPQLTNRTVIKE
jgi:hypothetical protein